MGYLPPFFARNDEPGDLQGELLELIVKAGRRVTHDLEHAAADIMLCMDRKAASDMWHARSQMWRKIFYPANGAKDYRHRLHSEIFKLEDDVKKLKQQLISAGITPCTNDDDIPF